VFPEQQLSNAVSGRVGFQLGAHASIDMSRGNELRPRIDYTLLDGGSFSFSSLSATTSVHAISVGMDYLAYLNVRTRGFYVLSGLGMNWWSTHYRFQGTDTKTAPGLTIGMGDRFSRKLALEFDYDFGQFRNTMGSMGAFKVALFYDF